MLTRSEARRALIVLAAFVVALTFGCASVAKWKPEYGNASPEIQKWYGQQYNGLQEWCCNESDAHPFFGDYKMEEDGSVTLQTEQGPHNLPAYMVLKGSNPTGHAVWWKTKIRDYCFAPGTLS